MEEDWKTYKVSDFVDINPKVSLRSGTPYSFVEMKDLDSNNKYVLPSDYKEVKGGARFQNQDTLFARITPCLENGKICQVKGLQNNLGFGSTEFLVFRGKHKVSDSDFIFYLSRHPAFRRFAESKMIGTSGRQRVAKDAFENLQLLLPPLPEQRAIASILSGLDDKIELNLQMNKTLEEMAMALYKHWFVDFGPFQDREFVSSELGEIPKGWEVQKIKDHYTAERGLSYKGMFLAAEGDGIPMHNLNSVFEGGYYKHKGLKWYTGEYKERHIVKPGDLIVANTEQGFEYKLIGSCALIPESYGPIGIFSHHLYKLSARKDTHLTNLYLYYRLLDPKYRFYVTAYCNGTTVNMMPIEGVTVPNLIIPDKESISIFSNSIKSLQELGERNYEEIQTLTSLRDTLLSKLISGEVRVKDAAKSLAEVL